MKVPQRPPGEAEYWQSFGSDSQKLGLIFGGVIGPMVNGRYVHWDKLRRLEPPEGLD